MEEKNILKYNIRK